MANLDVSLYSIALAIILASIYLFTSLRFNAQNFLWKAAIQLLTWAGRGNNHKTHSLENPVTISIESTPSRELILEPKWSTSWWIDKGIFQLEHRAIFSTTWLFVTHTSRFQKPGDYRTFEIAGFSFIIILGKDRQLRTFHNVCRHRAYAVTKKVCGSTTVLGCRYHGWSYDTKGNLIKAPEFENVKGFQKSANGLWEVKTIIRESLVFVNFDAGIEVKELDFVDSHLLMKGWKIKEMKCVADWTIEGAFNWKLVAREVLDVNPNKEVSSWLLAFLSRWKTHEEDVIVARTTRVRRLNSGRVLIARLLPKAANATTVEYTLYSRISERKETTASEVEFLKKAALLEISQFEARQQKLQVSSFAEPGKEDRELRALLKDHAKVERHLGREIYPAARKQIFTQEGRDDDDLCRELEAELNAYNSLCSANAKGLLDW